ncbi:MAG: DNA polymerase IV [Caldilineaceae bacterium]|nr:DNA polymerase IV [Caldilineaceae bacterium]MBP8108047.1 DNA polymerase IV [Caldilineaceae bacterium]MBP8124862.1 DNA polymerase IV [Caldilineaceae bacterium]MBP9072842.1 DNA polymerase IV [Caldilineaceae bacterium]
MNRNIIHLDLDAFFCSVEMLRDPSLRGKAFAVGGTPEGRGVVASCSYPARAAGVHSAMPMSQALKLCPTLLIVDHHFDLYHRGSRAVMARLHALTPLVEQISIDEAFLDVTARPESGEELARQLQATILGELLLPCSVGVASNKLVAKIATDVGKERHKAAYKLRQSTAPTGTPQEPLTPPNSVTVVPTGMEAAFLAPLPSRALWGVGPKTGERLAELGMHTIGDIAAWDEADLARRFGKHGEALARHAKGIDDRPIVTEYETKSVSRETTFSQDETDAARLDETLVHLAGDVARQLGRNGLQGTTIKLKIRWPDFTTLSRQVTLARPTDDAETITATARKLLADVRPPGQAVRLIGVGVSGFADQPQQLSLFDLKPETEKDLRLRETIHQLWARFGPDSVHRASSMPTDEG